MTEQQPNSSTTAAAAAAAAPSAAQAIEFLTLLQHLKARGAPCALMLEPLNNTLNPSCTAPPRTRCRRRRSGRGG